MRFTKKEDERLKWFDDWAKRMEEKYGEIVVTELNGRLYSWADALRREIYGTPDNSARRQNEPIFNRFPLTNKAMVSARFWESGNVPIWVQEPRLTVEKRKELRKECGLL